MNAVVAIARLRLAGYVRSYAVVAPTLAGLVVVALLYGGGIAEAAGAYGVSAIVMFPVFAWQTKILLDAEPDVQRRLIRVSAGPPGGGRGADREIGAGLLAALATTVPTIAFALALPWVFGGVKVGPAGLAADLAIGVWAHALAAVAGVALGAWAGRALSRTAGIAVSVLAGGSVLAIVLGLSRSPLAWLAPPLDAVGRDTTRGLGWGSAVALSLWALGWAGVVGAAGWWVRRRQV